MLQLDTPNKMRTVMSKNSVYYIFMNIQEFKNNTYPGIVEIAHGFHSLYIPQVLPFSRGKHNSRVPITC